MAKHFKLRLSLSSFQFCRPKQPYLAPKDPTPAAFCFSPVNPKSVDITYPNVPEPPPTTPEDLSFTYPPLSPNTTTAVDCGCRSFCNTKNHYTYEQIKPHQQRLNNSSTSDISDGDTWPTRAQKSDHTKRRNKKKKEKASVHRSKCSAKNSAWFSTDDDDDDDDDEREETESLVSTSRSYNSSYDFGYSLETMTEQPNRETTTVKGKKMKNSEVQRQKKVKAEEKVKDSYAVVKNSNDPCEDFKRSMLEMVMEKQMFEAKELEQLLLCFLSLNSRVHHAAIVQAFSEIWEILFCQG